MGANQAAGIIKLRLRFGDVEIDYEGTETYLREDLLDQIEKTLSVYSNRTGPTPKSVEQTEATVASDCLDIDTNTVASYLDVKTGPELVLAAAVNLRIIQNKQRFTRDEIRLEMQGASSYYTANHTKNLSAHLTSLIKSHKLLRTSGGEFALSADAESDARAKLAEHR